MPVRAFATVARAATLIFAAMLSLSVAAAAQTAIPRVVTGQVVAKNSQAPLAHAMVSLLPLGRQTFTDDEGRFAFSRVPAGSYRLRTTHLAYAPIERSLLVSPDSETTRVRVELDAVNVRLATVKVMADAPCVAPGAPDAAKDREFAVIFQQLVQNAQQYRLLADSFPYAYHEERTQFSVRGDSVVESYHVDTALLRSDEEQTADGAAAIPHPYHRTPGRTVSQRVELIRCERFRWRIREACSEGFAW